MTQVKIDGFDKLKHDLSKMADGGKQVALESIQAGGHVLEAHIKNNVRERKLWRTGNLFNSIQVYDVKSVGNYAECYVGSRGVIYARIHEFGGIIRAKRAKALHWVDNEGNDHFAQSVQIPARPYVRPAADEHKEEVINFVIEKIRQEVGRYAPGS